MKKLCRELAREYEAIDDMVKELSDAQWESKTPFYDWTIHDEICHITYFDDKANLAATDPDGFNKDMAKIFEGITSYEDFFEKSLKNLKKLSPKELMKYWISERTRMIGTLELLEQTDKIPWYGPPMNAKSFVIARIMETWAHGQDIADTVKHTRKPSDRLKYIAEIGIKTFGWSYVNRQREKPSQKCRVELTSPSGETWIWNEDQRENLVTGSAEDFCLVVSQRRHIDDTGLKTKGEIAREWMLIAQAFAGPAEMGPDAGKFK